MNWKMRPLRQFAPLGSRGVQNASGGVFSNAPLLSAVYGYNTIKPAALARSASCVQFGAPKAPANLCNFVFLFVFAFARDVMWDCARGAGWCARRVPQIDHHQDPTADQAPNTKIHQTLRSKIDYPTPGFCTRHQQNTIILSAGYIVRVLIKTGIWFKQR